MVMKVLVTGGCGYIGSALVADLLKRGDQVVVVDELCFGGESVLPFFNFDTFQLIKCDVRAENSLAVSMTDVDCVVHLAAIVGFPACEKAGRELVWRVNVEGTKRVFEAARIAGVKRLIFTSSYSSYGASKPGMPVTEESPLHPQSSYAESQIEAEVFLLSQNSSEHPASTCLRLATVFGISPRTRFDLIVNQFILEAHRNRRLEIYQEDFKRSFVHVRDVVRAMLCVMDAPVEKVSHQIFNVGSERLNTSKQELVELIRRFLPDLQVVCRNASFSGDMRSIHVSFAKIRTMLGYEAQVSLEVGIEELLAVLRQGIIIEPTNERFRNHPVILV